MSDAQYLALGDELARRVAAVGVDGLSDVERTLWLCREFDWAVRYGGFLGFLLASGGEAGRNTAEALRVLGLARASELLLEATSAYERLSMAEYYATCDLLWPEVEDLREAIVAFAERPSTKRPTQA
jgi:hypothetical protein